MLPPLACTYMIINNITNDYYIGSAKNYKKRWRDHVKSLNNNNHRNIHLQNAWNKYGESSFRFQIVEMYCNSDVMLVREQYLIDHAILLNRKTLYNLNLNVKGFHGRKHTLKTRKLMSRKRLGVSLTKGENNPNAKLNWEKVREIRKLYDSKKYNFVELGGKYGVTYQTISSIIKNKIWKQND